MHFCYTFTFSIIHPTLSHPIQLLKLFCSSVRLSLFQSSIPPNPTFEIVWHFLITFPFSIFHPTQIPLTNIKFSFRYRRIDMPKKSEGGWSGIGTANSGIDPTHVYFLNDHPTQIPPSEILGPVVQNCHIFYTLHTKIHTGIENLQTYIRTHDIGNLLCKNLNQIRNNL